MGFRVQGSEFRVQGAGFRVQGFEVRLQGSGFWVQGDLRPPLPSHRGDPGRPGRAEKSQDVLGVEALCLSELEASGGVVVLPAAKGARGLGLRVRNSTIDSDAISKSTQIVFYSQLRFYYTVNSDGLVVLPAGCGERV